MILEFFNANLLLVSERIITVNSVKSESFWCICDVTCDDLGKSARFALHLDDFSQNEIDSLPLKFFEITSKHSLGIARKSPLIYYLCFDIKMDDT